MIKNYKVAIVGATGKVGDEMIKMLEISKLLISEVRLLASKRSIGKIKFFRGIKLVVQELNTEAFEQIDIALFTAGTNISKKFVPVAVKKGVIVIDNTSYFRMNPEVPLVIPEVNKERLKYNQGIISNPNCSTIQLLLALKPIYEKVGLKRIIVSTYQAVSGAGRKATEALKSQTKQYLTENSIGECKKLYSTDKKNYQLAFNILPQIDKFSDQDYTLEEWKMIKETKKIIGDDSLKISTTCVRVPIIRGHSESVYVETKKDLSVSELKKLMKEAPGITLEDDPYNQIYPQALNCIGKKQTFIGRIRKDIDIRNGFHFWIVSDNLLKGAAWNSVQIFESLCEMKLI